MKNGSFCYRIKSFFITILYVTGMLVFSFMFADNESMTVFADPSQRVICPIIVYHNISDDSVLTDPLNVTWRDLEADIKSLKQEGYEPVFIQDLIDFVYDRKPLPEKPVVLTFDNGLSSLTAVLPVLQKYNFKASVSVVGHLSELSTKNKREGLTAAYLTWDEISDLYESGLVEINGQSYNINDGEAFSDEFLYKDALKLNKKLQEQSGVTPAAYVYSISRSLPADEGFLKKLGFRASMSCDENMNVITTPESLFGLCRYSRRGGISSEEFIARIIGDMPY
ncbi:MAG: Poly-beta-1,6-N-acetyl-D-glucosamine N-deacetylase precursor [Firmicutes bacterium ADurb.Bin182]|nr:MAG: Poly-beta-1,6-N-acetyl-D-glucosamine N-deacetylase precursor [Firmicutes bacterium ADurb.Bin182]